MKILLGLSADGFPVNVAFVPALCDTIVAGPLPNPSVKACRQIFFWMPKANSGRWIPKSVALTRVGVTSAIKATVLRISTAAARPNEKVLAHGFKLSPPEIPFAIVAEQG